MKITGFTVWLVPHNSKPFFRWRKGLPHSHGDLSNGRTPVEAIIRMETDSEHRAAISIHEGVPALDLIQKRYHEFIGDNPLLTERLWTKMWEIDRVEEIPLRLLGALDLLAWDIKSKVAGMPIYQMLGGNDTKVPAYASTVTFDTMDEYERHIKLCQDVGFKAFKLHAWGDVKEDIKLSQNLRKWVGDDADLMFDGSAGWDYVDALKVGRALQDLGFHWYEEPMREFHLGSYAALCEKLTIPILAAETSDGAHWNMASWIEAKALHMTRVNAGMKGGITGSMKIVNTSQSFGMRAQVHGGGLANAQLCAAIPNNDYYEQLVINEEQIKGLKDFGPLAIKDGYLNVSESSGLGFDFDWNEVEKRATAKFTISSDIKAAA